MTTSAAAHRAVRTAKPQASFSLAQARAAAASEDWRLIVSRISADPDLASEAKMMSLFIIAAGELDDQVALGVAAKHSLSQPWSVQARLAIIRSFIAVGQAEAGWRLLTSAEDGGSNLFFAPQVRRLRSLTKDPALREEMRSWMVEATLGGVENKARRSKFTFPRSALSRRPLGTTAVWASSAVPARHLDGFQEAMEQCLQRFASPAKPSVREYEDVFVDRYRQIWRPDGQILSSKGHPVPEIVAPVKTVPFGFLGVKNTRGIYHWIVDRVPLLACLMQEAAKEVSILLAEGSPAFERETLALLDLPTAGVVDIDQPVFVKRLLIGSVSFQGLRHWDQIAPVFEALKARAAALDGGSSYPEKIYISRRDAVRRPMLNEDDVERELEARGFTVVRMSEHPLWRQIRFASSATTVVAPHGAGLSHLMFLREGAKIVEILPIMDGTYALRFNYARLSIALGLDYHAWLENQSVSTDKWRTDVPGFLRFLDDALN